MEKEMKSQAAFGRETKRSAFFSAPRLQCLFVLLLLLAVSSCAPRYVGTPSYKGVSLDEALAAMKKISTIDAVLAVEYEKGDGGGMSGDAHLTVTQEKLDLRIYYLGFLAGEVSEEGGIIKSKPRLDRNKGTLLVDGLRNSLFWWEISDYAVSERDNLYVLKNSFREVAIDRETLLPVRQTIELENGDRLEISYESPARVEKEETAEGGESVTDAYEPLWYQSEMNIAYRGHTVKVRVKSYSTL
ncbi:MAG: hypothetical protein WC291_11890 [Thermodesulfovibrionales bacterium]|jgi:hypothetical protein